MASSGNSVGTTLSGSAMVQFDTLSPRNAVVGGVPTEIERAHALCKSSGSISFGPSCGGSSGCRNYRVMVVGVMTTTAGSKGEIIAAGETN